MQYWPVESFLFLHVLYLRDSAKSFNTGIDSCNPYHTQNTVCSIVTKIFLMHFLCNHIFHWLLVLGNQWSDLHLSSFAFSRLIHLESYTPGNWWVCLISFSIIPLRFMQVVTCISSSFLCIAGQYFIVWTYFFFCLSIQGLELFSILSNYD